MAGAFLRLGLTSFGGPVAHLGYFQKEFVECRRWLDDPDFADLVALCQFLPGPASSQVAFCLGMRRAGLAGALLASICFLLPSAAAMILLAYGITALGNAPHAGWLHGLKLAAVAVVAQAVWRMGARLCPDTWRRCLAAAAAGAVLLLPGIRTQVGAIAACALCGLFFLRGPSAPGPKTRAALGRAHAWAAGALAVFGLLLFVLPVAARLSAARDVQLFDRFYRAGALVFGGGHVVLPLLRSAVVPPGWIGDDAFIAGYGAVQAMPGPLFSFAGYLGTVIQGGSHAWVGGILALFALYLPGWLLVGGAYPFWHWLRLQPGAYAGLAGANAAVVGLLLAALYHPLCTDAVKGIPDLVAAVGGIVLLEKLRAPPWAVVVLLAAAGQFLLT